MSRPALTFPAAVALACLMAAPAAGASMPDGPPPPLGYAWTPSPWSLVPMAVVALLYVAGLRHMHRASVDGIPGGRWRGPLAFSAGMAALGGALVWPLDTYAGYALSAHVAQHMTLLACAPPLLLVARPARVAAHALPPSIRARLAPVCAPAAGLAHAHLGVATLMHVATMWVWHLPAATAATLASEPLHRVMLASVVLAGLWFWSAVLHRLRARDGGAAGGCVALVTAMMLMGFLGALLTFSPRLLYPAYTDRALLAGLDAVRDQQLAGLLMWVPSGLPYLLVCMGLVVTLLRDVRGATGGPAA